MTGANNPIVFRSNLCPPSASAGCRFVPDGKGRMSRLTIGARSKLAPSVARPNLFSGD